MASLTERLARCYTGAVHDVLRMMGHENVVLPPDIKAIAPGTRLAGPVWTVSGHLDRTKTRDETLLGWCTLLSRAPAGHVVVCQPNNHEIALMGELSAQTLHARGVLGPRHVAPQPEQLVGDPGQHHCCCCWAWECQPP